MPNFDHIGGGDDDLPDYPPGISKFLRSHIQLSSVVGSLGAAYHLPVPKIIPPRPPVHTFPSGLAFQGENSNFSPCNPSTL